MSGHFYEAFVQAQVVSYRILPALFIIFVIWEVFHDVLVDAVKSETFLGAAAYRHHNEGIVTVSRFLGFLFVRFR